MADAMFQDFKRQIAERLRSEGLAVHDMHPPSHLPPEAIRRKNEPDDAPVPAVPRVPDRDADPLFRLAGIGMDDEG